MTTHRKKYLVVPPDQHVDICRYDQARGLFHLHIVAAFPGGALQQSHSIFADPQLRDQQFEAFGQATACQFYLQSAQALGLSVTRAIEPVLGACYYAADEGGEHYFRQLPDRVLHVNGTVNLINQHPVGYIQSVSSHKLLIQITPDKFHAIASQVLERMGLIKPYESIDLGLRLN